MTEYLELIRKKVLSMLLANCRPICSSCSHHNVYIVHPRIAVGTTFSTIIHVFYIAKCSKP